MKMEKFAENVVGKQIKNPWIFIAVFLLITLMLIPGIFNLVNNVEPSLEKVLPQDVKEVQTMNNMRSQFGADMMYLIVYTQGPIFDARHPEMLQYIDSLSQKLRTREHILQIDNAADLAKAHNQGIIPGSLQQSQQILSDLPETQLYVNDDSSFSVIRIRTNTGASAEAINDVVNAIETDIASMESDNPGVKTQITGFNAIDKATFDVIMSDFAFITLVSMASVMTVVYFTFKSFVKGMLPMAVVMTSLLWTMGIVGYLGLTITVVTMVAAAMIMGLGIDFGIHVVHNFFELRKKHARNESLQETMKELFRAMVGASLTTISGFLALLFGVLPAMKTLGIVLAIGIFTTLLGAIFLLPVLVFVYDRRITEG